VSKAARNKGLNFERAVVNMLKDELGINCKRVLDQYREGNLGDIVLEPFVIECKRYSYMPFPAKAWWDQAWAAGEHMSLTPILVYKFDRLPIQCVVPMSLLSDFPHEKHNAATVSWDTLMMIFREELNDDVL